jgi:hypothetical protein
MLWLTSLTTKWYVHCVDIITVNNVFLVLPTQDSVLTMYASLPLHTRAVAERFEIRASEYSKFERIGEGGVGQVAN